MVRDANDRYMDNRAKHFAEWLARVTYDDVSLDWLTKDTARPTLIGYLDHVVFEEGSIEGKPDLAASTIAGYLNAAIFWLRTNLKLDCTDCTTENCGYGKQVLSQASKWRVPKPKRLPYTYAMFETHHNRVSAQVQADHRASLYKDAAVQDWTRLGLFTGSRPGEYAQTVGTSTRASTVPNVPAAGEWIGEPLAFIASDFTFFDKFNRRLTLTEILDDPDRPVELHVRFRFDKSGRTFTVRKFRRGSGFLCPILAAMSILLRAAALNVPSNAPVGVFYNPRARKAKNGVVLLQSSDVIEVMRSVCLETYPDPRHYYHINYKCIDGHAVRVTAAMVLFAAGVPKEVIAFRLRWKLESVDHYLRDCAGFTCHMTQAALIGSLRLLIE